MYRLSQGCVNNAGKMKKKEDYVTVKLVDKWVDCPTQNTFRYQLISININSLDQTIA
jgi:hypothetical protein